MSGVHRLCYYCIKKCLLVRLLKAIGDRCFLKSNIVVLQIYTYFFIKNANLLILTFCDEIADKKTPGHCPETACSDTNLKLPLKVAKRDVNSLFLFV